MSRLRITLGKSTIGHPKDQKDTARALGLGKLNATVVRPDNPAIRGMVRKLHHLVTVEAVAEEGEGKRKPRARSARRTGNSGRSGARRGGH
jgi:large subunit ribosomal protein L30